MAKPEKGKKYTYADYLTWNDGNRYELINGEAHLMDFSDEPPPASEQNIQRVKTRVLEQLTRCLDKTPYRVCIAPFEVRFVSHDGKETIVKPDLCVVHYPTRIDGCAFTEVPDMIVEIHSIYKPDRDYFNRFNLYREAGVQEHWIIMPEGRCIQTYLLDNGNYIVHGYGATGTMPISILRNCTIDLSTVFPPREQEPPSGVMPPEE